MATDTAAPPASAAPATTPAAPSSPPGDKGLAYRSPGDPKGGFLKSFHQLKSDVTAPKASVAPTEPAAPAAAVPEPSTPETKAVTPAAPAKSEKPAAQPTTPAALKKGLAALDEEEAPVTPEESKTDPADDPPAFVTTDEGKGAWKGIKAEVRTLNREKATWETERNKLLADLEAAKKISDADPVKQEAEALKKRVAELEPIVARSEYKQSDAYKAAVDKPMRDLLTKAATVALRNKIDQSKIETALWEQDEMRQNELLDELAETLPGRDKDLLYGMANRLQELIVLDDEMSKNASVALAEANKLAAEAATRTKAERRANEMREIAESRALLEKSAKLFKLEGESEDAAIKAILDDANSIPLDEMEPKSLVDNKILSLVAPRVLRNLRSALAKITSLEAEVEGLSSASPRTSAGTTPGSQPATKKVGGFFESMKEGLAAAGR